MSLRTKKDPFLGKRWIIKCEGERPMQNFQKKTERMTRLYLGRSVWVSIA